MDLIEAVKARHSVRAYEQREIEQGIVEKLKADIAEYNKESGLNIQLVTNEPKAFESLLAHYGKFRNVTSYIAIVGGKGGEAQEAAGYYGERLVLTAQTLGLNTCWVAMTFSKKECKKHIQIAPGEKLIIVIALGYGQTQGKPHKSRPVEKVSDVSENCPQWYKNGIEAALLAPTAINQQKFYFSRQGQAVRAVKRAGFNARIDLGIVKCHFELGAGKENFDWAE